VKAGTAVLLTVIHGRSMVLNSSKVEPVTQSASAAGLNGSEAPMMVWSTR
jgi:hypothetical protein